MADDLAVNGPPRAADTSKLRCFVIGPIGNRHAPIGSPERTIYEDALLILEQVIEPACERVGLTPVRADTLARAGVLNEQIFRRLHDDDVVIADLTGANPNVMYELGLRHSRDKITLQIGEYGRLPFDVSTIRTVQFSSSVTGRVQAREELTELLSAALAGEYDRATATTIWGEGEGPPDTEGIQPEDEDGAVSDETEATDAGGPLDLMAGAEERLENLEPITTAVTNHLEALSALAQQATAEIADSDRAGRGMRGRLAVTARYAAGLDRIATEFDGDAREFAEALEAVSAGIVEIIKLLEADPSQLDSEEAMETALSIRRMAAVTRGAVSSTSELVGSVAENAKIARALREPSAKLTRALNLFVEATSAADDWDRRLQALGVPAPTLDEADASEAPAGETEPPQDENEPDAGRPDV